jgi:CRAL/TRIO domain
LFDSHDHHHHTHFQKAAKRYAKYWDKRVEIFGADRAFRALTAESMLPDSKPMEIGAMQVIRRHKTATDDDEEDERDMLYVDVSKVEPSLYSRESGCRAFWYFFHSLLEDEQVQKRGLIVINYSEHFGLKNRDPPFVRMCIGSLQGCLPIRLSAFHGCHPPKMFRLVTRIFLAFLGERLRKRVLPHFGSHEAVVNVLVNKYSIPRHCIPTDIGGDRELDVLAWLQERRAAGL